MAFPSFTWALWSVSLLTALLASTVPSNTEFDVNALQPMTSDETVSEGGAVTLTCRVAESDNSSLQWSNTAQQTLFFGAKRALRDNRIKLHRSTPTELSITISDVELGDEGEYTCSLFTMPVLTAVATVTVLGVPTKPQIVGYNDAVPEGGKVTLTCTTTGSKPPARLRWFRGDQELQGRPDVVEPEPDVPTFKVISELDLEVSRDDDNALITCAVEHPSIKLGEQQSEQPLRVLFTPVVDIQPESDLPREGERFYLQCMGNGNPSPLSYTWERKDGELPLLAKADGAYLMFELLNKSDNGVYLCQINNGIGKSQGAYTLQVQGLGDVDASPGVSPLSPSPAFEASAPSSPPSSVSSSPSSSPPSQSGTPPPPSADATAHPTTDAPTTPLSNALFPDRPLDPSASHPAPPASPASPASPSPSLSPPLPANATVSVRLNGLYTFTDATKNIPDPTAMSSSSGVDHAVIGGVVAVIVFILLCLLIVLGRYLIRHKGTYLTHEAKGSDDAPDADTAIINAEGGHSGAEDKKEYFI